MNEKNIVEKNITYSKQINKNIVILLIVSIISIIISLLEMFKIIDLYSNYHEGEKIITVFLKTILYIPFLIILFLNRKKEKLFMGKLSLITGIIIILTSISGNFLFNIIYFILGGILTFNSFKYIKELKINNNQNVNELKPQKNKLKYINMILILIPIINFFIRIILNNEIKLVLYFIDLFVFIFIFISSIILIIKKYTNTIVYIIFIISIFGNILYFNNLNNNINEIKYRNKDQYHIEILKNLEQQQSNDIEFLSRQGYLPNPFNENVFEVLISKEQYESTINNYNSQYPYRNSIYDSSEIKKYNCDGYTELKQDYSRYNECLNDLQNTESCKSYLEYPAAKTYIYCTDKYVYKTEGFEEEKYEQSKN